MMRTQEQYIINGPVCRKLLSLQFPRAMGIPLPTRPSASLDIKELQQHMPRSYIMYRYSP
eukprot:scaffold221439_cov64-Attheya_sp.AAC.3